MPKKTTSTTTTSVPTYKERQEQYRKEQKEMKEKGYLKDDIFLPFKTGKKTRIEIK